MTAESGDREGARVDTAPRREPAVNAAGTGQPEAESTMASDDDIDGPGFPALVGQLFMAETDHVVTPNHGGEV